MGYTYQYPMFAVATDVVVFSIRGGADEVSNKHLSVLLVMRGGNTLSGMWALPGGFVKQNEDVPEAAIRELEEETGLGELHPRLVGVFGKPGRDPRDYRVVSIAYYELISFEKPLSAGTDAQDAMWFPLSELPENLAFDHREIISSALQVLRRDAELDPQIVAQFLPKEFALTEARTIFAMLEGVDTKQIDQGNFQKWIMRQWNLKDTGKTRLAGSHRPSKIYKLRSTR